MKRGGQAGEGKWAMKLELGELSERRGGEGGEWLEGGREYREQGVLAHS